MQSPYNPLDKLHLGESIRDALLKRPVSPLPPTKKFHGAGIYALYYTGPFAAYEPIAKRNRDGLFSLPLYVGKAVPEGARRGSLLTDDARTSKLFNRMKEHANSIAATSNLQVDHFFYRYLVVEDIWIPLGETLMIKSFKPIWNHIDGFGIHTPGKNRPQQTSAWDTLHPGRSFVSKVHLLPNAKSQAEWIDDVRLFIEKHVEGTTD